MRRPIARRMSLAAVCVAVALGMAAFVPPCLPSADAFENPKVVAWCILLAVAAVAGGGRVSVLRRSPGSRPDPALPAVLLLGWMALRTLAAGTAIDAMVLVGWALPPALYLAGRRLDAGTRRCAGLSILAVAAAEAALALLQRAGADPVFGKAAIEAAGRYSPARMVGTVGYQNQLVDELGVCAALALAVLPPRVPRCAAPLALAGVSALAGYRSGLCGVALGAALAFGPGICGRRIRKRGFADACAFVAALAVLCFAVPQMRERTIGAVTHPTGAGGFGPRVTMARAALAMVEERPLTGWGAGAYTRQYMGRVAASLPEPVTHDALQSVEWAREPHDDLLHLWCEWGAPGVVLSALWVVLACMRSGRAGKFLLGFWAVVSTTGFPWHDAGAGPLFGFVLGLLGEGVPAADGERRKSRACSLALSATGLACAVFAVLQVGTDCGAWRAFPWQGRSLALEGGLLAAAGRHAEAKEALLASWSRERSPAQCNNLAHCLMKLGDFAGAENVLREWAASGIEFRKALAALAGAQEAQGKWLEAGRTLVRRHRLWPGDSSDSDIFRACALLLRGGDAAGAEELARAFKRRNEASGRVTAQWRNLFGAIALSLGDHATAGREFGLGLQLDPTLESARRNLRNLELSSNSR